MTATSPRQTTTPAIADLKLRDVLKTLPRECFQQNRRKAITAALFSVLMVCLGYGAIALSPWYLLPLAWIFTGTALTGCFVIAHDCGHRSFARRPWVNDLVGHLFLIPLIYPFHCWRILHDRHHTHTNKVDVDNAWHPFSPKVYATLHPALRWGYQMLRGKFWWVASIVHWIGLHFNLNQFEPKDRNKAKLSIGVTVISGSIILPSLVIGLGFWGLVKFWLLPWMVYHFWMSTFTLVHHTTENVPFREASQWNEVEAQLFGTVHCEYPAWVESLCHHINVHVPHHLSTGIPSYNLRMAYDCLKQTWGNDLQESRFSWALMREITERYHLYEPGKGYLSFREYRQRAI